MDSRATARHPNLTIMTKSHNHNATMKRLHADILSRLATLLLCCAVLGSCSDSTALPGDDDDAPRVVLSFTINTGDTTGSRAYDHTDETEDPGNAMERMIVTDNSRIYVFNHNGGSLVTAIDMNTVQLTPAGDNRYRVTIELEKSLFGNTDSPVIDLAMVANLAGQPDAPASLDALASQSYAFAAPTAGTGIPMWGCMKDVTLRTTATSGGTIDLLRAYAKVVVELGETVPSNYTVTAQLTTTSNRFYAAPYDDETHTIADPSDYDDMKAPFAPRVGVSSMTIGSYPDDKLTFYVPEARANEGNRLTLAILDGEGNPIEGFSGSNIYIALYSDNTPGEHLPLLRNHIYTYQLDLTSHIQVRVRKWGYHKIEFDM